MSGEVIGQGRFRVDRRRALDKMEKFQLEDPYRYVLEVLVAARCGQAERVAVTNDSDDFVAAWQGDAPSRDELEALFDHLFGTPDDDHGRMLQHLALAAISSLALKPRWLRIDRGDDDGAHRIEITDPTETVAKPLVDPLHGVRFDLREQLGQATIAEALVFMFQEPVETRLIRGASRWYPVPIVVNGKPLPRAQGPEVHLGALAVAPNAGRSGALWLVPATGSGRIDILRHGIVVAHYAVVMPRDERTSAARYEVVGWFDDPQLRLNASRSAVVQDESWTGATTAIDHAVADLLHTLAGRNPDAALVRVAISELRRRSRGLGAIAGEPCATDLRGRSWTYTALTALVPAPAWTAVPDLYEQADPPYVVFGAELGPWLEANVQGCLGDVARDLARRADGRKRENAAVAAVPRLGGPQTLIDAGPLQGAIRLVTLTEPEAAICTLTVLLRGRVLERVTLPAVGGMYVAIATDSELTADPDFKAADRGSTGWRRITAALTEGMYAELRSLALQGGPRGQVALGALCAAITTTEHVGSKFAARVRARLDPELLAAPVFRTGEGRRIGLVDVTAVDDWYAIDAIPEGCPPRLLPNLLILAPGTRFERWLGCASADVVHDEVARERRLSVPRRPAQLNHDLGLLVVDVEQPGLKGQLAVPQRLGRGDSVIEILRDGYPVETLNLQLAFAGVVGVIDVPDADVNRAHDRLATDLVAKLPKLLGPAINELAVAHWLAIGVSALRVDPRVLAWAMASGLVSRHDASLFPCPAVTTTDGTALTFADLDARAANKQPTVIVREAPPPGFPFPDVVIATSKAHSDVLLLWLGKAATDGTTRLATMRAAHVKFLQQPDAIQPAALATRTFASEGEYEGVVLLPKNPSEAGLQHVEVRWQNRVLGSRKPGPGGAWVAAWGPAVAPNDTFDGPRDGELLRRIGARASREFESLVEEALAAVSGDDPGDDRSAWLALVSRTKPKQLSTATNTRLRKLRLIRRVDGEPVSIDAIIEATRNGATPRRLPVSVKPGPAPHEWYLYEPDGVELITLVGKLADGSTEVEEHREALRKLGNTPRRRATVAENAIARAPLKLDGHVGEVGLFASSGQLHIQPLHEGIPLAPIVVAFPISVQVVVSGPSITPDRALTRATATPAWDSTCAAIAAAAHAFARDTLLGWVREHALAGHPDVTLSYAMSDAGRGLKVLPFGSDGLASRDDLDDRYARDGVIGTVSRRCKPFVAGEPPLLASGARLERLRTRYKDLVDLDPVATRHQSEPGAEPPGRHSVDVPGFKGSVGLADAESRVEIYNRSILITALAWDRIVPLRGWLGSPDFTPTPRWDGLAQDGRASLEVALERAALRVLHAMIDADPSAAVYRDVFEHALFACCPDADALRAAVRQMDPSSPAARLAQLPLFADTRSQRVSLYTLAGEPEIRAVRPGQAWSLETRRYIQLDELARERLADAFVVVDGDAALKTELAGRQRRASNRFARPGRIAAGTLEATIDHTPMKGRLWLADPDGRSEVAVVVDGSRVRALDIGVPGLAGFVEGPFAVDLAFTTVTLQPAERAAIDASAGDLLTRELQVNRIALVVRLIALDGPPGPAWDPVAWFVDPDGLPLTFGAIRALVNDRKPVPVALPDADSARWWKLLYGNAGRVDDSKTVSKSARDRQRQQTLKVAKRLAPTLTMQQFRDEHTPDVQGGASAVFAAWELVARLVPTPTVDDELETLLRVATELRDVTSPKGG